MGLLGRIWADRLIWAGEEEMTLHEDSGPPQCPIIAPPLGCAETGSAPTEQNTSLVDSFTVRQVIRLGLNSPIHSEDPPQAKNLHEAYNIMEQVINKHWKVAQGMEGGRGSKSMAHTYPHLCRPLHTSIRSLSKSSCRISHKVRAS